MTTAALRVFILCGLPFAGKSTIARALGERLDLEVIEVDRAMRQVVGDTAAGPIPREAWITAYRVSYRAMETALAAGRSVVLDATNYRRIHRDLIRAKAARFGATAIVIHVDTLATEIQERRARNRIAPNRSNVAESDFRLVLDGMQAPAQDEVSVRYALGMGIDDLIRELERTTQS